MSLVKRFFADLMFGNFVSSLLIFIMLNGRPTSERVRRTSAAYNNI